MHAWAGEGGRTFACVVALAAEEGCPLVAVGPEPPEGWGGVRGGDSRLLKQQRRHTIRHNAAEDGFRVACVRARTRELPNARADDSLSCEDHADMPARAGRARIEAGDHLDHSQASRRWTKTAAGKAAAESIQDVAH